MITFPHKKWNPIVPQLDPHDGIFYLPPPALPFPGKSMHLSAGVLAMAWISGSEKNNEGKVFADNMEIVSRGCEPKRLLVPHLNVFSIPASQPNILIPLLILGSSSKCQFAVGSVKGKDGPIAVSIGRIVGINQACADRFSMPTSLVINWGTVHLGFTWGDLLAGLLCMAFDVLIDFLMGRLFDKLFDQFPKGLFKGQFASMLRSMGIDRRFRNAAGRYTSLSEFLAKETSTEITKHLTGMAISGVNDGFPNPVTPWITGDAVTGNNGYAEQLGAGLDNMLGGAQSI